MLVQHLALANTINDFKFDVSDTSPPKLSQERLVVRNLAVIDLTNALANTLERTSKGKFHKEEWLKLALARRGTAKDKSQSSTE